MTYLIITGVVLLLFFFTRNYWADKIGNFIRRRKDGKKAGPVILPASVFSPAGVKRTFIIALEIEEGGNGEVIISLAKIKQPEV